MEDLEEGSSSKFLDFVRSNVLIVGLLGVGIVLIVMGLIQMMGARETEIKFEESESITGSAASKIKVDVAGEVLNPGVYTLAEDARIQDALAAAGGLSADADREYIQKNVNLAERIIDGSKLYIPKVGEEIQPEKTVVAGSSTSSSTGTISINSATSAELEELPGIGPVNAGKIIDGRPYGAVEDLRSREILGEKTFENIVDLISL